MSTAAPDDPPMEFPESTFTGVLVHSPELVYISSVADELAEQDIDHTAVLRWHRGHWGYRTIDRATRGMCVPSAEPHTLLNMAVDGTMVEFTFPGERTELVDPSDDGPSDLVHLRAIARIGGKPHVAGMARRVYRRSSPGVWQPIDQGVFVPSGEREEPVGFNTIDGYAENELYAAGWNGEIWYFDGSAWHEEVTPTNLVLNQLVCAPEGTVYVAGMAGVLIRGAHSRWSVIPQDVTREDFWGMTYFKGHLYVASYDGVCRLKDDLLEPVDMGLEQPVSTAYLHSDGMVMWSVGAKHLAYTEDGRVWHRAGLTEPAYID